MAQLRIDARNLAAELDSALACLEQGDEVLLERDGQVVAQLAPCAQEDGVRGPGNILRFIEERLQAEPLDDETIKNILEAGSAGSLQRYFQERLKEPPAGDWFADAVMEAVEAGNQPVEDDPWERS